MKLKDVDKKGIEVSAMYSDTILINMKPLKYTICRDANYNYSCDCQGFRVKTKCKHVKRFLFKQEIEKLVTEMEYSDVIKITPSESSFEEVVDFIYNTTLTYWKDKI